MSSFFSPLLAATSHPAPIMVQISITIVIRTFGGTCWVCTILMQFHVYSPPFCERHRRGYETGVPLDIKCAIPPLAQSPASAGRKRPARWPRRSRSKLSRWAGRIGGAPEAVGNLHCLQVQGPAEACLIHEKFSLSPAGTLHRRGAAALPSVHRFGFRQPPRSTAPCSCWPPRVRRQARLHRRG